MFMFCITGKHSINHKIKLLNGTIEINGDFIYRESFSTTACSGNMTDVYPVGFFFETEYEATEALKKIIDKQVAVLADKIKALVSTDIVVLSKKQSLNYANSYHKNEKGFKYNIVK